MCNKNSGDAIGKAEHLGVSYPPCRRISSHGRGHTAFRGSIAADLVQWISVFGDCAQRWKPSSLASGCYANHQSHRQIREEKSSGSPSGDLHFQAHFCGPSGTQSVCGDQHLLSGKD